MRSIYEVSVNSDLVEGRGIMVVKARFDDPEAAHYFAEEICPKDMGGHGGTVNEIPVYKDIADYRDNSNDTLAVKSRQAANPKEYAEYQRLHVIYGTIGD